MAFVDSAVNAFMRRHGFLSTEVMSTPQKRRRIVRQDSSWDEISGPVSRQLSSFDAEVPSNASFMARGPGKLPPSHVNPVRSSVFLFVLFVSNIVIDQDNGDDDTNGNTWTDLNPDITFNAETNTRHSCPRTLLSHEEGGDEDTSQAAVNLSRISITAATPANDKGEAPQWMIDALKVGLVHVVVSLGTH